MKNADLFRGHPRFKKMLDEVKRKRIITGRDKIGKPVSTKRITLALSRHQLTKQILRDIEQADLK